MLGKSYSVMIHYIEPLAPVRKHDVGEMMTLSRVRLNHTAVSRHMRNDDAMHILSAHRQKVHLRPCEPHCRQQMLIDDGEILPPPLYRPQKAQRIRHQVP